MIDEQEIHSDEGAGALRDQRQMVADEMQRAIVAFPARWALRLVDRETGEYHDLPATIESIGQAYHMRSLIGDILGAAQQYARALEGMIALDMAEQGASERVVDGIVYEWSAPTGTLVTDVQAQLAALRKLTAEGLLVEADWAPAYHKTVPEPVETLDQRVINKLIQRRGNRVRDDIEATRKRTTPRPSLKIKAAR